MIDTPAPGDPIDLPAVLARIDRDLVNNAKLLAKACKSNRRQWVFLVSILGFVLAAAIARLPEILHALGIGHLPSGTAH